MNKIFIASSREALSEQEINSLIDACGKIELIYLSEVAPQLSKYISGLKTRSVVIDGKTQYTPFASQSAKYMVIAILKEVIESKADYVYFEGCIRIAVRFHECFSIPNEDIWKAASDFGISLPIEDITPIQPVFTQDLIEVDGVPQNVVRVFDWETVYP